MFSSVEFIVPVSAFFFFLLLKSVEIFALGIQTFRRKCKSMTIVSITIFDCYLVNLQLACLFVFSQRDDISLV